MKAQAHDTGLKYCLFFGFLGLLVGSLLLTLPGAALEERPQWASVVDPVIKDGPLPDVPIVFVSRNRLPNWNRVHIGPPVDVPGRELTPGGRLLLWEPDGTITDLTEEMSPWWRATACTTGRIRESIVIRST